MCTIVFLSSEINTNCLTRYSFIISSSQARIQATRNFIYIYRHIYNHLCILIFLTLQTWNNCWLFIFMLRLFWMLIQTILSRPSMLKNIRMFARKSQVLFLTVVSNWSRLSEVCILFMTLCNETGHNIMWIPYAD